MKRSSSWKVVKGLMKDGAPKVEIFSRASQEGMNLKKVAKYLAIYPDRDESERYHRANGILIGLYIAFIFFGLLGAAPLLSGLSLNWIIISIGIALLIPSALVYSIYKKQSFGYMVLCLLLVKGVLDMLKDYQADQSAALVGVGINIALIFYVYTLKKKLFPYQNFLNTRKGDDGLVIFSKSSAAQSAISQASSTE